MNLWGLCSQPFVVISWFIQKSATFHQKLLKYWILLKVPNLVFNDLKFASFLYYNIADLSRQCDVKVLRRASPWKQQQKKLLRATKRLEGGDSGKNIQRLFTIWKLADTRFSFWVPPLSQTGHTEIMGRDKTWGRPWCRGVVNFPKNKKFLCCRLF